MSNEPTIDSMNEAIALFDGWKIFKGDPNHVCLSCDKGVQPSGWCTCDQKFDRFQNDGIMGWRTRVHYHSSWDDLMPVWFKIQSIGADMGYVFKKFHESFHAGIDHQSIGKCHSAVFQFIQWYNQSNTTNEVTT